MRAGDRVRSMEIAVKHNGPWRHISDGRLSFFNTSSWRGHCVIELNIFLTVSFSGWELPSFSFFGREKLGRYSNNLLSSSLFLFALELVLLQRLQRDVLGLNEHKQKKITDSRQMSKRQLCLYGHGKKQCSCVVSYHPFSGRVMREKTPFLYIFVCRTLCCLLEFLFLCLPFVSLSSSQAIGCGQQWRYRVCEA